MSDNLTPELSLNLTSRRILLSGAIDEVKAHDFREAILDLYAEDPHKEITIYIDTYGGSSYAMFAMYDVMKMVSCPITTIGTGKVMSGGVLILAAGDKRFLTSNAMVMLHQVSTTISGEVSRLHKETSHVAELQSRMYYLLAKHTGQTTEQLSKDLAEDKYMNAKEAIEYGVADSFLGEAE